MKALQLGWEGAHASTRAAHLYIDFGDTCSYRTGVAAASNSRLPEWDGGDIDGRVSPAWTRTDPSPDDDTDDDFKF